MDFVYPFLSFDVPGIEKAKQMLEVTIENGIKELDFCKEKTEFLKEIALYIKNREK